MKGGSEGDIDDLLKMKSDASLSGAMSQLVEKLERAVLEQKVSGNEAGAAHEVNWSGRQANVTSEKLKLCFTRVAEKEILVAASEKDTLDAAMALYDQLYDMANGDEASAPILA